MISDSSLFNSSLFWVVFGLVVLLIIYINSAPDISDVSFDLSETGSIKVKNDMMRMRITISSAINPNPDQSMKQISPTVEKIKGMLSTSTKVSGLRITNRTMEEYEYLEKGERKLKGYRARSDVSFEISVLSKEGITEANRLQSELSSMSKSNAVITIDSAEYYVSDSYRSELQGMALRDAIQKARRNASILVSATYPGYDYKIQSITVRESNRFGPVFSQARSLEANAPDTVEQGDSVVSVGIDAKIGIV